MADPLSIAALALTAGVSVRSLCVAINRYRKRNKTLERLQNGLEDLGKILDSLAGAIAVESSSMLELLHDPVDRCGQVCQQFEESMKAFGEKSRTGVRDWARMEFKKGDINEFIDTIEGYKSTISVGLGTITMQAAKVSHQVIEEYNELVQDTAYSLEVHLQRIEEKLERSSTETTRSASDITVDLRDEQEVTKQCLRICDDARSYIESLANRESPLLREPVQNATEDVFEAQLLTRQTLGLNLQRLEENRDRLQERLEFLVLNGAPRNDEERRQLQEDFNSLRQCQEVCKLASEVSRQKVYRVGEVIAEGNSDQVVVTTLADLFEVKKAEARDNSAQLIGSMTAESLRDMVAKRYDSRFGTASADGSHTKAGATSSTTAQKGKDKPTSQHQTSNDEQSPGPTPRSNRPSPNEMRKRATGGAAE